MQKRDISSWFPEFQIEHMTCCFEFGKQEGRKGSDSSWFRVLQIALNQKTGVAALPALPPPRLALWRTGRRSSVDS